MCENQGIEAPPSIQKLLTINNSSGWLPTYFIKTVFFFSLACVFFQNCFNHKTINFRRYWPNVAPFTDQRISQIPFPYSVPNLLCQCVQEILEFQIFSIGNLFFTQFYFKSKITFKWWIEFSWNLKIQILSRLLNNWACEF